jgi:hypothetical protein
MARYLVKYRDTFTLSFVLYVLFVLVYRDSDTEERGRVQVNIETVFRISITLLDGLELD